jgi:hypothetical protein
MHKGTKIQTPDRPTDRQTDRQTSIRTDRQIDVKVKVESDVYLFGLFSPCGRKESIQIFFCKWLVFNPGKVRFDSYGALRECATCAYASSTVKNSFFLAS